MSGICFKVVLAGKAEVSEGMEKKIRKMVVNKSIFVEPGNGCIGIHYILLFDF